MLTKHGSPPTWKRALKIRTHAGFVNFVFAIGAMLLAHPSAVAQDIVPSDQQPAVSPEPGGQRREPLQQPLPDHLFPRNRPFPKSGDRGASRRIRAAQFQPRQRRHSHRSQ